MPFCPSEDLDLTVGVIVNGEKLDTWTFKAPVQTQFRELLIPEAVGGPFIHILFVISEPRAPSMLGISSDVRSLGLGFIWLQLSRASI